MLITLNQSSSKKQSWKSIQQYLRSYLSFFCVFKQNCQRYHKRLQKAFAYNIIYKHLQANKGQQMQKEIDLGSEIIRDGRYSIRILTRDDSEDAIRVATDEFVKKEPLSLGFFKQRKNGKEESRKEWKNFWKNMMDDFLASKLSVGLFDLEDNNKLVGTFFAKNLHLFPRAFLENPKGDNFIKHNQIIAEKLNQNIREQFKQILFNPQTQTVDLWAAAIEDEHMGKKLLHKMAYAVNYLASLRGYQYSLVWASNFRTGIALSKLKYEQISEYNVRDDYEVDGIKYFENIEEDQKMNRLFLKKLNPVSQQQLPLTIEY